jgi:HAD superfamily hydrolase (TIGR01457 family)
MPVLADRYDAFLFDLDGVLYRGHEPIPGAGDAVDAIRRLGKGVAFVTNNSSRTPAMVAAHLRTAGISAEPDEVETSALTTTELLASRGLRHVYVIGEAGIREALTNRGIAALDGEPESADAVVVGWDREVDYGKLRRASLLIERGSPFVATNADASYPAPDGRWPGAGAIVAAIETTTGVVAEVVGKPHPPILRAALRRAGGARPLVVGDRLDTDIAGANRLGWDSLLVLTGITGPEDLAASTERPTFVARGLEALTDGSVPDPSPG